MSESDDASRPTARGASTKTRRAQKATKSDKDEGTPLHSWTRWHGTTHVATVFQYGPQQFSALGTAHGEDALPKGSIPTLEEAQSHADRQVQMRWNHDCAAQRCSDWMES